MSVIDSACDTVERAVAFLTEIPPKLSIVAAFDHRLRPAALGLEAIAARTCSSRFAALASEFSNSNGNTSGDAFASPSPAMLLQWHLYPANNLLYKSDLRRV